MHDIIKQIRIWHAGLIVGSLLIIMLVYLIKQGLTPQVQNVTGAFPSPLPSPAASTSPIELQVVNTVAPKLSPILSAQQSGSLSQTFGVVVDDYPHRSGTLSSLESRLDYTFATVSIFKQFGHAGNSRLNLTDLDHIKSANKKLLIAWEPWDPAQGLSQTRDYLAEIPTGLLDNYLNQFAQDVKNYGSRITIRFGHEMNGNWYPWGNRPQEYQLAYRYIVDLFKKNQVANVRWMWSINSENLPVEPVSQVIKYYPGDGYVDLIGLDGLNFGTTLPGSSWREFSELFYPAYAFLNSKLTKPVVISETASAEQGGNKAVWVKNMAKALKSDLGRVEEVIWFNLIKEADWRMDSTSSSLDAFNNIL